MSTPSLKASYQEFSHDSSSFPVSSSTENHSVRNSSTACGAFESLSEDSQGTSYPHWQTAGLCDPSLEEGQGTFEEGQENYPKVIFDSPNLDVEEKPSVQNEGEYREESDRLSRFSSIALASGTGKDVVSFSEQAQGARFALTKLSVRAIAVFILFLAACTWLWLSRQSPQREELTEEKGSGAALSVTAKTKGKFEEVQEGEVKENKDKESHMDSPQQKEKTGKENLVVYISGAVNTPGVYSLASGARINDILNAAGGPAENADLASINLALLLNDADHVHIPAQGEQFSTERQNNPSQGNEKDLHLLQSEGGKNGKTRVNINTATVKQLQEIPGVGPVMAAEIVKWREKNGKFFSPEELLGVSGIGEKTLEKMRSSITVK